MKYLVFLGFSAVAVPSAAALALSSARWRGRLLALLVFSTVLGDSASLNFYSMASYRGPDRGYEVTLTDLLALGLGVAFALRGRLRLPPVSALWLAWGAVGLVGALAAYSPLLASFTLWKLARLFLLYAVLCAALREPGTLDRVRQGLLGVAAVVTFLALKQKYLHGIYRIHGPFDHSNTVPLYANLVLPVLLLWGLADRRLSALQAVASVGAALGLVFAVAATFSRAGTALALAVMLGVLGLTNLRARGARVRLTTVVVGLALLAGGAKAADSFIKRFQNAPKSSEEARHEFNHAAELMSGDRLLGVGLNNFSRALTVDGRYNRHIRVMADEAQGGVCHHIWWLTAAETGWLGLLLFAAALAQWCLIALRRAWPLRSLEQLLLAAALLGMLALHTSGFLEWALRITPVSYQLVVVAGLVCGCAHRVATERRR